MLALEVETPGHCCVGRSWVAGDWFGAHALDDFGLLRFPVPARSDHGGGPLVSALRPGYRNVEECWSSAPSTYPAPVKAETVLLTARSGLPTLATAFQTAGFSSVVASLYPAPS